MVGFTEQEVEKEPVLILEGSVNVDEVTQLLDILDGLSEETDAAAATQTKTSETDSHSKRTSDSMKADSEEKPPGEEQGTKTSKKPKTDDK